VRELTPIQERRAQFSEKSALEILRDGAVRARKRASQTMAEVNSAMHLLTEATQ
jgi:tryptophanyl-tRNA synthetase